MQLLKYILAITLLILFSNLSAQELYLRTFGNPDDPSVVYLHGGPGGSSIYFENLIAEELSQQGYYVIIYDRAGEGRSEELEPNSSFIESIQELDSILMNLKIANTTLIGHSFGGLLALMYSKNQPDLINSVILSATPLSMYRNSKHILNEVKKVFIEKNKIDQVDAVDKLEEINRDSCKYGFSNLALLYANSANLYAKGCSRIDSSFKHKRILDSIENIFTFTFSNPTTNAYELNEKFNCKDFAKTLTKVIDNNIDVMGIFGQNDIYVTSPQVEEYSDILGEDSVEVIKGACHNLMITHRNEYMTALVEFLSRN